MARVESKSILAKLLAMENLIVQVDPNAYTAAFDPQSRVVQIPVLNDKYDEDYVYDGFVSHEIGHALWTPPNFKKYEGADEVPFPLLNVLEDIRIEKNIKEMYPGTRKVFSKFGQFLFNNDFFGIGEKDYNDLSILDRINIYSKVGAFSGLKLTNFEKDVIDRALETETFQDVIELAKKLLDDVDATEQPQQELQAGDGEGEEGEEVEIQNGSGTPQEGEAEGQESQSAGGEEGEEESEGEGSDSDDSDGEDEGKQKADGGNGAGDMTAAQTMDNLDANMQKELTDSPAGPSKNVHTFYIGEAKKDPASKKMYKPATETLKENRQSIDTAVSLVRSGPFATMRNSSEDELKSMIHSAIDKNWKSFQKENKHVVDSMVKEFEMKKSADESKRTKIDDSGVIDPRKMKDYKLLDDIFQKNTTVKSGKNHGIIMFVDFSGSMNVRMEETMKQILIMVMFARKVNLPFEVYAFTNYGTGEGYEVKLDNEDHLRNIGKVMDRSNSECLFHQILSNSMKKKELDEQMKLLYARGASAGNNNLSNDLNDKGINPRALRFNMGGTPLNQSILASEKLINDFKDKNNVQICNTIFLTDGMSNNIGWASNNNHTWFDASRINSNPNNMVFDTKTKKYFQIKNFVGHPVEMQGGAFVESAVMYKILMDRTDTNLLIYFIGHNKQDLTHHYQRAMPSIKNNNKLDMKELNSELKSGVAEVSLTGNDSYFLIDDNKLSTEGLDLDKVKDDKNVKSEFRKQSKNKKNSRVFAKKVLSIISQDMS